MSDEQKQTPNLDGRILREIALGSEGYAIRIDGESVRDPLCRGMIDLRAYPFFTSKAVAQRIVRDWNAAPKMYDALKDTMEVMRRFRDMCPKEYDDMTRYIGIEWATMWDNNKAALKAAGGNSDS